MPELADFARLFTTLVKTGAKYELDNATIENHLLAASAFHELVNFVERHRSLLSECIYELYGSVKINRLIAEYAAAGDVFALCAISIEEYGCGDIRLSKTPPGTKQIVYAFIFAATHEWLRTPRPIVLCDS